MKKTFLFCFMVMVILVPHAHAESYYNFTDANPWKGSIYQGGTNYCWAASAAYMLAWSGWGLSSDPNVVWSDLTSHFPDNPYLCNLAIDWYFNGGSYPGVGNYPGGNYYPDINPQSVMQENWTSPMSAIIDDINAKDAVDILILRPGAGVGHYLTVWGYQTDSNGNVIGLYMTDSESQTDILQEISVWQDSRGVWDTSYDGYYIFDTDSLEQKDDYVGPAPLPPVVNSVPEPFTALLLGMGLVGLVVCKKKVEN